MVKILNTGLIIAIAFLTSCYTTTDCVCPAIYNPVCGANGQDYGSPCMALCDDMPYTLGECPVYGLGTVLYTGDSLCGFVIRVLDITYKPDSLSQEFKVHNMDVNFKYRRMNETYSCESQNTSYQEINILEISEFP